MTQGHLVGTWLTTVVSSFEVSQEGAMSVKYIVEALHGGFQGVLSPPPHL